MKVANRELPPIDGRQVLYLQGIKCVIPRGMKVVEMWPTTPYILGSMTPAYSWGDKIRVNPDLFARFDIATLIEECIHCYQDRRMRGGFFLTYIWQVILDVFRRRKGVNLHNANLMEREAMNGAEYIAENFDYNFKTMDVEEEIKKHFGW